jgi:NAD(P)H dehydrogenase (quinone)
MKIYAMLVHPAKTSLNHALFDRAVNCFIANGHEVKTLDLYRSKFDPRGLENNFKRDFWLPGITSKIRSFTDKWLLANQADLLPKFARQEIEKLKEADLLYIQCPLWWWTYPSLLKAYIENVFAYDALFTLNNVETKGGKQEHDKFLTGRRVMMSMTTGGSQEFMESYFGKEENLTCHMKVQFSLVGYEFMNPYFTWSVGAHTVLNAKKEKDSNYLIDNLEKHLLEQVV